MVDINSPHTIREYLKYFENKFLIFSVNKFSYKLKEQVSAFRKMYIMDRGLIEAGREFNLKEGIVLTMFQEDTWSINGFTIKIEPVWTWLLNNVE